MTRTPVTAETITDAQADEALLALATYDGHNSFLLDVQGRTRYSWKQLAAIYNTIFETQPRRSAPNTYQLEQPITFGAYIVSLADGDTVTLRFRPREEKGWVVISYDSPDGKTAFASIEGNTLRFWKKNANDRAQAATLALTMGTDEMRAEAGMTYAEVHGCCYHCNRTLTVPASMHRGLGPTCAKKLGVVALPQPVTRLAQDEELFPEDEDAPVAEQPVDQSPVAKAERYGDAIAALVAAYTEAKTKNDRKAMKNFRARLRNHGQSITTLIAA